MVLWKTISSELIFILITYVMHRDIWQLSEQFNWQLSNPCEGHISIDQITSRDNLVGCCDHNVATTTMRAWLYSSIVLELLFRLLVQLVKLWLKFHHDPTPSGEIPSQTSRYVLCGYDFIMRDGVESPTSGASQKGEVPRAESKRAWILPENADGSSEMRVSGIIRNLLYYYLLSITLPTTGDEYVTECLPDQVDCSDAAFPSLERAELLSLSSLTDRISHSNCATREAAIAFILLSNSLEIILRSSSFDRRFSSLSLADSPE